MTALTMLSRPLAQRVKLLHLSPAQITEEPDIPDNVIQAAGDALDRGETHYTDRPGIPELRTLVAERLNARYGLSIDPQAVTITCGATEARFCAVQVLAEADKALICPGDTAPVEALAKLAGVPLVSSPENAPTGSLLYLTPADDVARWVELAVQGGWWVIWDTTGFPIQPANPAQRAELAGRVVTIDDLEAQMPGWRVGWMAGTDKWSAMRASKQALTICTTNVAQWAALEYLRANT
jgi:aspartate/methionine/tyrosine aminotransferase